MASDEAAQRERVATDDRRGGARVGIGIFREERGSAAAAAATTTTSPFGRGHAEHRVVVEGTFESADVVYPGRWETAVFELKIERG